MEEIFQFYKINKVIHISAKFRKNIDLLEELILFEAEYLNLRQETECRAEGMVLESSID